MQNILLICLPLSNIVKEQQGKLTHGVAFYVWVLQVWSKCGKYMVKYSTPKYNEI